MSTYYNQYITGAPSGSPPGVYQGGAMTSFPGSPTESGPAYDTSPSPTGSNLACPRFPPYNRSEMGASPPPAIHPSPYYSSEAGYMQKRSENMSIYPENLHRTPPQNDIQQQQRQQRQQQQQRVDYPSRCNLQNESQNSSLRQPSNNSSTSSEVNSVNSSNNNNNNNSTNERLADSPPTNSSEHNTNNNVDKGSADEEFSDHSPQNSTGENSAGDGGDAGGSNVPMYPWMRSQYGESVNTIKV